MPALRHQEQRPPELTLLTALDAVSGPRLHEIAVCLGLWATEGMSKPELIRHMQRAPLVNVEAVWAQMNTLERGVARRGLSMPLPAGEPKPEPSMVRSLFEMLDPQVLSGKLGSGLDGVGGLISGIMEPTRRILSLLLLLPIARVGQVARLLEVDAKDPLGVATAVERRRIPSRRVLGALTEKELRTAAAVWALSAPREELIDQLSASMDAASPEPRAPD